MADKEHGKAGAAQGRANLYTIPQTSSFLDVLAGSILRGDLPDRANGAPSPLELAGYILLVPSRRAARAMRDAFFRASGSPAMLLPQIRALGDVDETLAALSQLGNIAGKDVSKTLHPAIPELERRLVLTEFVRKWGELMNARGKEGGASSLAPILPAATPAQASALAGELIELMDEAQIEGADISELGHLVPEGFSQHWQLTLEFLKIITVQWPQYLRDQKFMSAAERRDALIQLETQRLHLSPPRGPVIIAGEIGGVAAVGELMKTVALMQRGAVVLPGLDLDLDEESWQAIVPRPDQVDEQPLFSQRVASGHPEHPQYGLKQFLDALQCERSEVAVLRDSAPSKSEITRLRLISETMRPALTTDRWCHFASEVGCEDLKHALGNITIINAPTAQEEAEVIALILRRSAAHDTQTAALVTPDRKLARRVAARLEKWRLRADDSGGMPLVKTAPGAYLDLLVDCVANDFVPATLMALLKHPLTRLGLEPVETRRRARALELLALRQPRMEEGLFAIRRALGRSKFKLEKGAEYHPVLRRLDEQRIGEASDLLDRLESALTPLMKIFKSHKPQSFLAIAQAHREAAEASAMDEEGNIDTLWQDDAGVALLRFFESLAVQQTPTRIRGAEYPGFYRGLIASEVVRDRTPSHARLFIWGPMEARMQRADVIILGGLNEGSWPQIPQPDAWLSRTMRHSVGLSSPERKIGRSAHDVAQALGADRVYLVRATKVDGVPAVPSRWLLRLRTIVEGAGLGSALEPSRDEPWLEWAAMKEEVPASEAAKRPMPCPPIEARPRKLSVTRIEDWIANPYAIYARFILGLEQLPDLGPAPDAALRGQIIHKVLHRFSERHANQLPKDISGEIVKMADELMTEFGKHPNVMAFWGPRFERFAQWFEVSEPARRRDILNHLPEIEGAMTFDGPAGPFTLSARADRIDLQSDGSLAIYDYKTGGVPRQSEVDHLISPQLPLEAAIARSGGFKGLQADNVALLSYISVTGGEPPGEQHDRNKIQPNILARDALEGLKRLVEQYDMAEVSYPALRRPQFKDHYRFDDYEHLARVKEWSVEDGAEGGAT